MPRCTVLTYQTPGGNAPVDEYIAGLEGTAGTKAAALVKVLEAFGVPTTIGLAKREAFLFRNGKLVWRDTEASTDQQAADILKAISEQ